MHPTARFAAFRMCLGGVLLVDAAHLYAHRGLLCPAWGPLLLCWAAVLVPFALSLCPRVTAVANYLCAALLLGQPTDASQVAGDSVAITLCLLAVLLPVRGTAMPCHRLLLPGFVSAVYVDSALRKLASPMWRAGLGVWAPATQPNDVWTDAAWMDAFPESWLRLSGWGVIAFEFLFPFLYALRPTRTPAVLAGVALHLGIAVLYPIPAFSGLMLAAYAGLLPDRWYPRSLARPGPAAGAGLCRAAGAVALGLCVLNYTADSAAWSAARPWLFRFTGLWPHGVFDDALFRDYRYQLRLVPEPVGGPMPYSRGNLFDPSVRDRVWEHWWKRTQAPWVPLPEAEARLSEFAAFWWPGAGSVRIEGRPQRVELRETVPGLFRANDAVPWVTIGRVVRGPAGVVWTRPPAPGEPTVGDFVLRLLTE